MSLAKIESLIKTEAESVSTKLKAAKFSSSKLLMVAGAIALVIALRHFDITELTAQIFALVTVFLVARTIETAIVNIMNGLIEIVRVKAGKDDGAPAVVSGDTLVVATEKKVESKITGA